MTPLRNLIKLTVSISGTGRIIAGASKEKPDATKYCSHQKQQVILPSQAEDFILSTNKQQVPTAMSSQTLGLFLKSSHHHQCQRQLT